MNEAQFFMTLSFTFAALDVVSASLIADFTMRYKKIMRIGIALRFCLMAMAVGLLLHSIEQVTILIDYRPPRARAWVWIFFALHAIIITVWFRAARVYRHKKEVTA